MHRDRLNQLKQADSEMDQQIASREAEIERLKDLIRRNGNNDLSGGSMFSDPEEINRGRRVEELFQKLGSPSPYPHEGKFYVFSVVHLIMHKITQFSENQPYFLTQVVF